MTTALATKSETGLAPTVTAEQLDLVKKTVANGATDAELKLYLYDCQRQGVHPLDRLLHFTKRGGKYTPVTSIDLMRIRAAETGEYAGSDDAVFPEAVGPDGDHAPFQATVTVWRFVQGQRCAFTATARWSEYFPGEQSGHMWKKMPHTMLAKCAEALALRKGFPRQLAGLYASEELDQAGAPARQATPPAAVVTERRVVAGNVHDKNDYPVEADVPVDTETGEELQPAPPGYVYIANAWLENGWYHVQLPDANGGFTFELKTKKEVVGHVALQSFQDRVPVKYDYKNAPWLDAVHPLKREAAKPSAPLTADEIAF